jgi:hemin uptake protein HemP
MTMEVAPVPQPDIPHAAPSAAVSPTPRTLSSAEILQGEKKVLITHGEEIYRLLVTRNDKLILQK